VGERKKSLLGLFCLGMFLLSIASGEGQVAAKRLIIGTKEAPPFSIKQPDGTWVGISIDLWTTISAKLGLEYELRELDLKGLLEGVRDGSLDAAVAAMTITAEREAILDFTHSFYSTGLGIAVPQRGRSKWLEVFQRVYSWTFLRVVAFLVLLLFFVGLLVWIFERKRNPAQFGGGLAEGAGSGFWWAAVTLTTVGYGDKAPQTFGGRFLAVIWMFTGLIIVSSFIAAMTSALTVSQLESSVRGPEDLPRVRVGAIAGSTSADYLRERRLVYETYENLPASLQALVDDKVDALVYDAPLLRYLARTRFQGKVDVLAARFEPQEYAIALPFWKQLKHPAGRMFCTGISEDNLPGAMILWRERLTPRAAGGICTRSDSSVNNPG
jgi:ABC-type amino acid transport substrate-binding protein